MACPICDHSMRDLDVENGDRNVYWCPRCGTIKTETSIDLIIEAPDLVDRIREMGRVSEDPWRDVKEAAGIK